MLQIPGREKILPKVQIHPQTGALQQEQQRLQDLHIIQLTEPIHRATIIPV